MNISARLWNDVLKQTADRKRQGERPSPLVDFKQHVERFDVLVYNPSDGSVPGLSLTSQTFEPHQPIALAGPIFPPSANDDLERAEFDRRKVLIGVPANTFALGSTSTRYAVPLEPIEPGRIGRACFRGLTLAKVTAGDDANFCTVDVAPSSPTYRKLIGGAGSIRIMWIDADVDEEAERFALVCLDGARRTIVWAFFDDNFLASPNVAEPAHLADSPTSAATVGLTDVYMTHAMLFVSGQAYMAVLDETGRYTIAQPGEIAVAGTYSGGSINAGGIAVPVPGSPYGTLVDDATTVALWMSFGGSSPAYYGIGQGCAE